MAGSYEFLVGSLEHHFPTPPSGQGTHVDNVVSFAHHLLVVLDDDDCVARVAKFLERVDEAPVVALVKADARFVEDVEHVHELGTYLRGQADALALASAQALAAAREGEVVESHVEEELDAYTDFLQYLGRYLALAVGEVFVQTQQPQAQVLDVHIGKFGDVLPRDAEVQCLAVEARPMAVGADGRLGELVRPLLRRGAGLAVLHHLDVLGQPVVLDVVVVRRMRRGSGNAQPLRATVHDFVDGLVGNVLQGCFHGAAVAFEQCLHLPEYHLVLALPQGRDAPLAH